MEQVTNEPLVTFGCVMAMDYDNQPEVIKDNPYDDVVFRFCYTNEDENNDLTITSELRDLIYKGYFMVAVAQYELIEPTNFRLWTATRFSSRIRHAFANTVPGLVRVALKNLVAQQAGGATRVC
jgi:hypothetical protein